jgi:hypothetical protein
LPKGQSESLLTITIQPWYRKKFNLVSVILAVSEKISKQHKNNTQLAEDLPRNISPTTSI